MPIGPAYRLMLISRLKGRESVEWRTLVFLPGNSADDAKQAYEQAKRETLQHWGSDPAEIQTTLDLICIHNVPNIPETTLQKCGIDQSSLDHLFEALRNLREDVAGLVS